MKLGVVTVTYNSGSVLEEFLRCCEIQDFQDYVLVVVDNNSQDDSMKIARSYEGKLNLKVFAESENLGVAEGNNIGIAYGLDQSSELILILNNDVVFDSSFFGDLVGEIEKNQMASVLVPKVNYFSPFVVV